MSAPARKSSRRSSVLAHAVLTLFALAILLPPLWVLRISFVPDSQAYNLAVLPGFTLDNYTRLLVEDRFWLPYLHSLIAATASTLLALPFGATAGYALARTRTGGQWGRFFIFATQMLPPVALVLPAFALFQAGNLINSIAGLVLAYAVLNLPFLTWITMGFFQSVPVELEWAAMVEGATAWRAFRKIVLPVALPGVVAAAVLGFILAWNEFLFALIVTRPGTATIPVALAALQSRNDAQIAELAAGVVLGMVPTLLAVIVIRKHLVRGLSFGAVT